MVGIKTKLGAFVELPCGRPLAALIRTAYSADRATYKAAYAEGP